MADPVDLSGVSKKDLKAVREAAKKSMAKPGTIVKLPRDVMARLASAVDIAFESDLQQLRERARQISADTLKFRIR